MTVSIQNLSKVHRGLSVLSSLDFKVHTGETLALLGPNGAGKTTLLRIMSGYLKASTGQVLISNQSVGSYSVRKHLGYAPEAAPLYNELTVMEYLQFIVRLRGVRAKAQALAVEAVVELCRLSEYSRVLCGHLSKGVRQRVNLAQAIIHKPKVLLLDEPASGLDPDQVVQLHSILNRLQSKTCIVLSTHLIQHLPEFCSRALILVAGVLKDDLSLKQFDLLQERYFQVTAVDENSQIADVSIVANN